MPRCRTYLCLTTTQTEEKMDLAKMSTHTRLKALEAEAAKKKPKRKTKAKRDEAGRFVKEDADLSTPSF
jgi:hypothetical protein